MVAFITNNSFLDQVAFDGMRKHLSAVFSTVYVLDLGGNVRKNPKLSGTTHNVFGIQLGVSINLLIRKSERSPTSIQYARLDEFWRKEQKFHYLDGHPALASIQWQTLTRDKRFLWLHDGDDEAYTRLIALGTKESKQSKKQTQETVFKTYSLGVVTNRDAYVYAHDRQELRKRVNKLIDL